MCHEFLLSGNYTKWLKFPLTKCFSGEKNWTLTLIHDFCPVAYYSNNVWLSQDPEDTWICLTAHPYSSAHVGTTDLVLHESLYRHEKHKTANAHYAIYALHEHHILESVTKIPVLKKFTKRKTCSSLEFYSCESVMRVAESNNSCLYSYPIGI